ncbi:NAD(P)-dependent alcohol dehydrogenase [Microbulbifer sp. MLAF003]|uniref:zinc-dependent alcohol dehydrogenase family protein n=1 Tax=Microbulbifer sp. MLAF003 TaxID=3032582 RepID=UPI0024ADE291|nr:NAD(P)-dependent alcohol dehydrogenase [Microbulbifer sp. MLAF003]WHI50873.1 NAD(P)-dependent alcohol dehydrogenase [Microbulbifer sp. MLAF003]
MKALTLKAPGGLNHISLSDMQDPGEPGPNQIRVAIGASSLNYHDLLVANGSIPTEDGRILMSDGAGTVEAVGEGVSEFKVGDSVVSCFFPQWQAGPACHNVWGFGNTPGDGIDGMAAQYVVRSANAFTLAPTGWSHAESATITTAGLTAWRALVSDGKVKPGDTILTLGTGGVSIAVIQIANMLGAKVIVTSSSDEKLKRAKALGATEGINYRTHAQWSEKVLELTHGKGVDHIIELGGPATLEQSIQSVRVGGHISLIGVLTGRQGEIPTALLMGKQARLQGLVVGNRCEQQDYVAALEANNIHPVIDKTLPFTDLAKAFEHQAKGSHFGKICVEW